MIEKIIYKNKKTGFNKKTTTPSSGTYFIHRDLNGNFSTKWSGVWSENKKLFDYFAFKINDFWLSSADIKSAEVFPWCTKYNHVIEPLQLEIKEENYAEDNGIICALLISNKSNEKKKLTISVEAAINIRYKSDNWHTTTYTKELNDVRNCVLVKSEKGCAVFGAGRISSAKITFSGSEIYKDHYPGSKQRCYIPGNYTIDFEIDANKTTTIPFIFTKNIKNFDTLYTGWLEKINKMDIIFNHNINTSTISTPIASLDSAYSSSQHIIKSLIVKNDFGKEMFAGLPWFLEFWERDTLWTSLGFLDSGEFKTVKELLRSMSGFRQKRPTKKPEELPTVVEVNGESKDYSADIDPLFLYILHKYIKITGDVSFAEELKITIQDIISTLKIKNNLIINDPLETWMDTIKRGGTAIEIQSLWAKALENQTIGNALKTGLKKFWSDDDEFLYDTINDSKKMIKTANVLVPIIFEQIPKSNALTILNTINYEFLSFFGIQTRGSKEEGFDPTGYHTGAVWGLTTGWGACAFLKYGMIGSGIECLKSMAYDSERYGIGAVSECLDAKTGNLLGSPVQAWSSGLLIHAIDSYLFGINADMIKKEIKIEPKLSDDWGHMYKHGKKIGNSSFDITIDRTTYGLKIKIVFDELNDYFKCTLKLPKNCTNIRVIKAEKEKQFEGCVAVFKMDEVIEIKANFTDEHHK